MTAYLPPIDIDISHKIQSGKHKPDLFAFQVLFGYLDRASIHPAALLNEACVVYIMTLCKISGHKLQCFLDRARNGSVIRPQVFRLPGPFLVGSPITGGTI